MLIDSQKNTISSGVFIPEIRSTLIDTMKNGSRKTLKYKHPNPFTSNNHINIPTPERDA